MKTKKIAMCRMILVLMLACLTSINAFAQQGSYSVMEVVEVTFNSQEQYDNAYMDVDVWIELKKSGSANEVYRIPIFWDGGNIFRGRLVATSPGNWTWNIINATVVNSDSGFIGKSGSFTATDADVSTNANNHGFIRVAPNNRTLEYADGTPFFYTADTSWAILTDVFDFDNTTNNGVSGISFTEYLNERKGQGFNGMNVISSFPSDTYTNLWAPETYGKKTAANGETPFEINGVVDYTEINPVYWQSVDERMQFLSDKGFVTLFETVRRTEDWPFRSDTEKNAFYNYVRYLWARYGCYNMIFSWVHHDVHGGVYNNWVPLVRNAHQKLSAQLGNRMPYGQPRTAMSFNTTLNNWERDIPEALDVQNVSNAERDEDMHVWLNNIYKHQPAKPALNLEPFYAGWGSHSGNEINSGLSHTTMAQMQMYGSVLSGGLAGHAWGDAWHAGVAYGSFVNTQPQRNALRAYESQAMGHLKSFILDSGHEYHRLIPAADTNLSDSQGFIHTLSISDDKEFALGFFTVTSEPLPALTNLKASKTYLFEWWDVTNGGWVSSGNIKTSNTGRLQAPAFPNTDDTKNWAYRIRSEDYISGEMGEEVEEEEEEVEEEEEEEVEEEPTNGFALRINSGGAAVTHDGETFDADTYFNTGNTLDRPQTGLDDPFKSFRYSPSQEMNYDIPLTNGEYMVKLHFAELWFGATSGGSGGAGNRVFDVTIEGELAEDNLDVFAQVGADAMLIKTHMVKVTDGKLDIDFSAKDEVGGTRHPIINAIEILGLENLEVEDELLELVGHWPLDEQNGTTANNVSRSELNGRLENGLTFDTNKTNGQIKGALVFDGLDDRINLSDIDDGLQSNFSVSAWVKPSNADGGYQGVVGSSTAGGFMMFINRGKLAFKVTTNENGQKLVSKGSIQNNIWQMITCTFDGSVMRFYINGENIHSEPLSGTLKDKSVAWIGWSGWNEEYFEGGIDDVRLFKNAITKQQVISLFEEGKVNTTPVTLALKANLSMESAELEDDLDLEVSLVYPNPTSGTITVTGLLSGMKLELIDFSGKIMAADAAKVNGNIQMDLSSYARGVYVLRISDGAEVETRKIVLN